MWPPSKVGIERPGNHSIVTGSPLLWGCLYLPFLSCPPVHKLIHSFILIWPFLVSTCSGRLSWRCLLACFLRLPDHFQYSIGDVSYACSANNRNTGQQAPRHGLPLQILLKSFGFRPQNLQGSDFPGKISARNRRSRRRPQLKFEWHQALSWAPCVF